MGEPCAHMGPLDRSVLSSGIVLVLVTYLNHTNKCVLEMKCYINR